MDATLPTSDRDSSSNSRRDFLKTQAAAAATAAAGLPVAIHAAPAAADTGVRWDKAPCRFCGTGCSVVVGVQNDKVVAELPVVALEDVAVAGIFGRGWDALRLMFK
jgi:anaerobic selenocysteine-containing dehydrogenase